WADRFHARMLRTPPEMRHALVYVLNNWRKHWPGARGLDARSSAAWFDGWANTPGRAPGPARPLPREPGSHDSVGGGLEAFGSTTPHDAAPEGVRVRGTARTSSRPRPRSAASSRTLLPRRPPALRHPLADDAIERAVGAHGGEGGVRLRPEIGVGGTERPGETLVGDLHRDELELAFVLRLQPLQHRSVVDDGVDATL